MKIKRTIPRNVLIVGIIALFSGFSQDIISPIFPAYLSLLGLGGAAIGLIDGLLQGSVYLFRLISGVLSDKFHNRKWFVFAGYFLSAVSRPLLAIAGTVPIIGALRVADGIGKGTKDAPRDALIADSTQIKSQGRAFGFHRVVDTLGSVIGPLLAAGLLFVFQPSLASYRLIMALTIIPGIIVILLIIFGIQEKTVAQVSQKSPSKLPVLFWIFVMLNTLLLLTRVNDSLILLRLGQIHGNAELVPLLFAFFTLVYAGLAYPIGILSDKIGTLPLICFGWGLLTIAEFGLSFSTGIAGTLGLLVLFGAFLAFTEGSARAFIATLVTAENRGRAYSYYYFFISMAVIVGGYIIGKIWDDVSPSFAMRISSLGTLISTLLFMALIFRMKKMNPDKIIINI